MRLETGLEELARLKAMSLILGNKAGAERLLITDLDAVGKFNRGFEGCRDF